jgi:FtsH-binding integral membrane protein
VVFAVVGTFIQRRLDIFGAGLILGGVGTMIFAVTPYDLDDIPRFIGIAVILAVLIFVGYKVFSSPRTS